MTARSAFDPELPFLAYPLSVDFANTTGPPEEGDPASRDLLADAIGMRRWLAAEEYALADLGSPPPADRLDLEGLRAYRVTIAALLRATARRARLPSNAVRQLNITSAAAPTHAELVVRRSRHRAPTARPVSHAANWESELRGRIARSAIDLLSGPDRERLGICRAPSCGLLFVGTRQGQRWCSGSCGNRARVARHYHRRHGT